MNRKAFFTSLRRRESGVFGTSLSKPQVEGVETILDEGIRRAVDKYQLAYILATVYHETGAKMQPVTENLNYSWQGLRSTFPKYFQTAAIAKQYQRQPEKIANRAYGNRMGNGPESSGDGWRFRGRGYVQITGYDNYEKYGVAKTPEAALGKKMAAFILFDGMLYGAFTTRKLSQYVSDGRKDYRGARWVVNGQDKAAQIAGYAEAFETALKAAEYSSTEVMIEKAVKKAEAEIALPPQKPVQQLPPSPAPSPPKTPEPASQPMSGGVMAIIIGIFSAVGLAIAAFWGWLGNIWNQIILALT